MTHLVPHPVEIDAHRLSKSSGISAVDLVNTLVGVGGSLSGNVMIQIIQLRGYSSFSRWGYSQASASSKFIKEKQSCRVLLCVYVCVCEQRRRSRINEKMKALQSLPNSNKTDKASMLNEAIEYLKHLQLQVQTLSGLAAISAFVAPEVLSENYSEKVNIWSAGVLLHALLVAALPFKGDSLEAVCDAIKNVKLDFHSGI